LLKKVIIMDKEMEILKGKITPPIHQMSLQVLVINKAKGTEEKEALGQKMDRHRIRGTRVAADVMSCNKDTRTEK
jgi:hypothetical protein